MIQEIPPGKLFPLDRTCLLDVRSPGEYREATIPGAVNAPLLDDAERHLVGLTYSSRGPQAARELALDVVGPRLSRLYTQIRQLAASSRPVLFCWRGGMRSEMLARVLEGMGMAPLRVTGGYRAFRRMVLSEIETMTVPEPLLVLDGKTGAGKTLILEELKHRGYPVVDLEGMAQHRGSVFGAVGGLVPRGQKMFDALLWQRLKELQGAPCWLLEGESRKIGKICLPERLWSAMQRGWRIWIDAAPEVRVQRLLDEYLVRGQVPVREVEVSLRRLEGRLGRSRVDRCLRLLEEEKFSALASCLLEEYYDIKYEKSTKKRPLMIVDGNKLPTALDEIAGFLDQHQSFGSGRDTGSADGEGRVVLGEEGEGGD